MTHLARPVRTLFQSGQIVAVEPPLPTIERLSTDSEVAAGPSHVPAVEAVKQYPLQTPLCCLTQLLPEARQLAGLGLGGDGLGSRLAARLDRSFGQFAFGANPIAQGIPGSAATLEINVIGAQSDIVLRGLRPVGARLLLLRRGTYPRPCHTVLLSTTPFILTGGSAGGYGGTSEKR